MGSFKTMLGALGATVILWAGAPPPALAQGNIGTLDGSSRSVFASSGPVRVALGTRPLRSGDVLATAVRARGYETPMAQVEMLSITWSGKDVSVPVSAFLDIYDPLSVALEPDGKFYRVTIQSAAGHFSYSTTLKFDRHRVLERWVKDESNGAKNDVYEKTVYLGELADDK